MGSPLAAVLGRTRRGVDALVESVRTARSEPERAGYLAAGGLTSGARLLRGRDVTSTLRLTLPVMLAGTVLRGNASAGDKTVLLAGLSAGWLGEWEKTRTPNLPSITGITGVTGQHVAYSVLLARRGARVLPTSSPVGPGLRLTVWGSGIGLAALGVERASAGALAPAAVIAGLTVSATAALAQDRALQTGPVARQGLDHGGNLILVSEGLTLLRAVACRQDYLASRILVAGTTATAVIGHLLLIDGLMRK